MDKNVIQLHPKIDRNSPCPCGSGKKYKKCCLSKHEREARIRKALESPETVSDKYFSVAEYIKNSEYPLKQFDYFLIEILNISGAIITVCQKLDHTEVEAILIEVMKEAKKFFQSCLKCESNCLGSPMKKVSFKSLADKGLMLEEFPMAMQKPVALNFFYHEFINVVIGSLLGELNKFLPEAETDEIGSAIHSSLFDFISDNCWEECIHNCMNDHAKDAYCLFCNFGDNRLPCPKSGDISYEEIRAREDDMMH